MTRSSNITVSTGDLRHTRAPECGHRFAPAASEIEGDFRTKHPSVTLNALAVFTASHFKWQVRLSCPGLDGNRVPQVPAYQFGAGVTYSDPTILTLSAQLRILGQRSNDNRPQHALELEQYAGARRLRQSHADGAVSTSFWRSKTCSRLGVRVRVESDATRLAAHSTRHGTLPSGPVAAP